MRQVNGTSVPAAPDADSARQLRLVLVVGAIGLTYLTISLATAIIDPAYPGKIGLPDLVTTIFDNEGIGAFTLLAALACWMLVVSDKLRLALATGRTALAIVSISSLMSASIGVVGLLQWLVFTVRTGMRTPSSEDPYDMAYVLVGLSWCVGLVLLAACTLARRRSRLGRVVLTVVVLLPFAWSTVLTLGRAVPTDVLVCLPTTGFALWAVHGLQRHRRMPFRVVLAAFGWGAVVAYGWGGLQVRTGFFYLSGIAQYFEASRLLTLAVSPALFEELGKAVGVVLLVLVARRHVDNLVSGLVLGAAVGLGFNFIESVQYMTNHGPEFHHFIRQTAGIFTSHAAFTALSGAGIGLAILTRARLATRCAVIGGLGAAMCAHLSNNYLGGRMGWLVGLSDNPWVTTLLLTPASVYLLQLPFVIGGLLLLRRGLSQQYDALRAEVPAEAAGGHGAIAPDEIDALLRPARRFRLHVDAFRRGGPRAYRAAATRHAAQLDLAMARWHHRLGHRGHTAADVEKARDRVLCLRAGTRPAAAVAP